MRQHIVYVFKSGKKDRCYLYLDQKDGFDKLPEGLKEAFGKPEFLLMFSTSKRLTLPKVSIEELLSALRDKGFFLRIDSEREENLLEAERRNKGLPPLEEIKASLGDRHDPV